MPFADGGVCLSHACSGGCRGGWVVMGEGGRRRSCHWRGGPEGKLGVRGAAVGSQWWCLWVVMNITDADVGGLPSARAGRLPARWSRALSAGQKNRVSEGLRMKLSARYQFPANLSFGALGGTAADMERVMLVTLANGYEERKHALGALASRFYGPRGWGLQLAR